MATHRPHGITAILAVYNGERFIVQAVESMLAQTRRPDEVIVVDDGSTDRTAELVRGISGVDLVCKPNGGQGAALNLGVQRARGERLAFLDADDLWAPDKLALQEAALDADAQLEAVFGHAVQFREGVPGHTPPQPAPTHSTMLIRAEAFRRVGDFSIHYRLGGIVDWIARAKDAGLRARVLPDVVLRRRIHDQNIGITRRDDRTEYLQAVKASLDRRRRGAPS